MPFIYRLLNSSTIILVSLLAFVTLWTLSGFSLYCAGFLSSLAFLHLPPLRLVSDNNRLFIVQYTDQEMSMINLIYIYILYYYIFLAPLSPSTNVVVIPSCLSHK
ncbi:uncharacterized protein BX664DRAFT_26152 [Halteromyces radiatus]|uniref:uncharacterized protein n=1 Tax=Halteromyces radiatus TaxID=101107 RepID=UPI00221F5D34|nr:uncharacterized protein BX664DRAFT_26152 [Halteromyces radiatus]KAI8099686.1 hypothetical protein BX664DRAFT_26152 [Halteromyces radiatus]